MPAVDDVVIRTEQLTKVYPGGLKAVDELDLEVHQGEIFGLLGPNGAGKTTTAGMLTTRVIPTSGEAWVGGIDVVAQPAVAKRVIGVVSQTNTLDRSLDVAENLYFHGRYFGLSAREAKRKTDELLETFRLADRARANVAEMSGGMAQRLMVARAILHDPEVLFLDEPTSGLDPISAGDFDQLILTLQQVSSMAVFMVTHDLDSLHTICDRIAVLGDGKIIEAGTMDTMLASQHPWLKAYFHGVRARAGLQAAGRN